MGTAEDYIQRRAKKHLAIGSATSS